MNVRQMDEFTAHLDHYFEQSEPKVLHPTFDAKPHIDMVIYEPTEKYPFWKLVTMGAGDYKMPPVKPTLGNRNEYMIFVDPDVDMTDRDIAWWYYCKLRMVADYPRFTKSHITYSHSFEWEDNDPDDEAVGAFLEFPQAIENTGILHCKLGMFKTVTCLQVVLLSKGQLEMLAEIGAEQFSNYLYPEDGTETHTISAYRK